VRKYPCRECDKLPSGGDSNTAGIWWLALMLTGGL